MFSGSYISSFYLPSCSTTSHIITPRSSYDLTSFDRLGGRHWSCAGGRDDNGRGNRSEIGAHRTSPMTTHNLTPLGDP
jgi:hypothetical protein